MRLDILVHEPWLLRPSDPVDFSACQVGLPIAAFRRGASAFSFAPGVDSTFFLLATPFSCMASEWIGRSSKPGGSGSGGG